MTTSATFKTCGSTLLHSVLPPHYFQYFYLLCFQLLHCSKCITSHFLGLNSIFASSSDWYIYFSFCDPKTYHLSVNHMVSLQQLFQLYCFGKLNAAIEGFFQHYCQGTRAAVLWLHNYNQETNHSYELTWDFIMLNHTPRIITNL